MPPKRQQQQQQLHATTSMRAGKTVNRSRSYAVKPVSKAKVDRHISSHFPGGLIPAVNSEAELQPLNDVLKLTHAVDVNGGGGDGPNHVTHVLLSAHLVAGGDEFDENAQQHQQEYEIVTTNAEGDDEMADHQQQHHHDGDDANQQHHDGVVVSVDHQQYELIDGHATTTNDDDDADALHDEVTEGDNETDHTEEVIDGLVADDDAGGVQQQQQADEHDDADPNAVDAEAATATVTDEDDGMTTMMEEGDVDGVHHHLQQGDAALDQEGDDQPPLENYDEMSFVNVEERDLPEDKRLKVWAKLNKGQRCAVNECFCSTTGAYFPNPYKAHINCDQRRQEEQRLHLWCDYCKRGGGWTPQITSRRIQDFIGWRHFSNDDITEHRRIRLQQPQIFKRLKKGAVPRDELNIPFSREEKLLSLGVQESPRQRKRRERLEKAVEIAAVAAAQNIANGGGRNSFSNPRVSRGGIVKASSSRAPKQLPIRRLENALKHERRMRTRLEEEIDKLKVQIAKSIEGRSLDRTTKGIASDMQQLRQENKQLRDQNEALKSALIANSVVCEDGQDGGGGQVIMVRISND